MFVQEIEGHGFRLRLEVEQLDFADWRFYVIDRDANAIVAKGFFWTRRRALRKGHEALRAAVEAREVSHG